MKETGLRKQTWGVAGLDDVKCQRIDFKTKNIGVWGHGGREDVDVKDHADAPFSTLHCLQPYKHRIRIPRACRWYQEHFRI